ncbi:MAG: hypothetical protein JWQ76_3967 [Ramlibacter sp.]|nr:hypothetical protein [Ramlibacter sp.]
MLGLVLVIHLVGLEWAARRRDQLAALESMAPPMYTRLLEPAAPPPVLAQAEPQELPKPKPKPRSAFAVKPRPKASDPQQQPPPPEPEPPQVAEVPRPDAPPPDEQVAAADPPQPAASAPAAAASAPAAGNASWPADTRLSYQLGGEFRGGPLYGDARVQWQRTGDRYQVRLDVDIKFFTTYVMTSQGEVTSAGLVPRAYEEYRPGKRRIARFGDEVVTLDNGKTTPRPSGLQDTVSQFVDLAHRFSSGQDVLEVGRSVSFPLGRPGAVDQWTYDVVERVTLRTPRLGAIEAFHLKPRAIDNPRGNITAEMWFAPSLQYLPVRIQVRMGEKDYLDLLVEKIEQ